MADLPADPSPPGTTTDPEAPTSPTREWLVTNGLGGYASGTVGGAAARRYHGLLVAALPAPFGRTMMLNQVGERLRLADGSYAALGPSPMVNDHPATPAGPGHLASFRLDAGLPVWRYEVGGAALEKRLILPHLQNSAFVVYR